MSKPKRGFDMDRTLVHILNLLLKYRPEEITFARVAKATGTPRSTLYYYFSSSRMAMLDEAIRYGMARFVQLQSIGDYKKYSSLKEFEFRRMERSLRLMIKLPWAAELYFRYRNESGKLGESIRTLEEKYFAQMTEVWAYFNHEPASPHAIRFMSYMKLGLFFGFSNDRAFWKARGGAVHRKEFLKEFSEISFRLQKRSR